MRKVGVAAVFVLLAAGCGSHRAATPPPPPPPPPTTTTTRAAPVKPPKVRKPVRLEVTVINGDTWRRIPGAVVTLWHRRDRTNAHGTAKIRVPWRRPLDVHVRARGFTPRTVPETFRTHRKVAIRVYRPELQWPIFGANDRRTQNQAAIKLRPPFRSVWSVALSGLLEYSAVVSDGVAYIGNAGGTIFAISMQDGSIVWRHHTPRAGLASSPAVWGDKLVYHDMSGGVWMLDRATGRVRWHYGVGSPIESSPIVRNGVDYFGTWDGRIFALDLQHGRIRWVHSVGSKITGSVVLDGNVLYIGDYSGRLWSLYASNGRTRWTGSVNGRIYGTTAVAGGRVFVPSSDGRSFSAFSTSGRKLWTRYFGTYVYSSPAVWGGRVFFGSYNGVFYCLSAANGSTLWAISTGGPISGAAVVVDGVAYAGSFAHRIYGVDARTGRVLVRFPHGHYVPVSGNGMLLLFHGYGALYAMAPVSRTVTGHQQRRRHRRHRRALAGFPWPVRGAPTPQHEPVPILMYHVIAKPPAGAPYPQLYVSPSDFRGQVAWLALHGYTAVTLDRLFAHWRLDWPLPAHPVVLTFDDGYRADYVHARPILLARRWPGVLNLEVRNLVPSWGVRPWEVRTLVRDGWEIDAHTITHPDLTAVGPAQLVHEVAGSRADIRREFHVPVDFFCYPAGKFDPAVIAAVRRAGFLGATTELPGLATGSNPYELARIRVNGSDGVAGLASRLMALNP